MSRSFKLHEPWFVARPDAQQEDDGVLVVRALDVAENKGMGHPQTFKILLIQARFWLSMQ